MILAGLRKILLIVGVAVEVARANSISGWVNECP